ncbi:hypothetical protein QUF69_05880 [Peribacillus frigoritolerans]|nr:hypothetical protein [Peribacillus frigoritolerans]
MKETPCDHELERQKEIDDMLKRHRKLAMMFQQKALEASDRFESKRVEGNLSKAKSRIWNS